MAPASVLVLEPDPDVAELVRGAVVACGHTLSDWLPGGRPVTESDALVVAACEPLFLQLADELRRTRPGVAVVALVDPGMESTEPFSCPRSSFSAEAFRTALESALAAAQR